MKEGDRILIQRIEQAYTESQDAAYFDENNADLMLTMYLFIEKVSQD